MNADATSKVNENNLQEQKMRANCLQRMADTGNRCNDVTRRIKRGKYAAKESFQHALRREVTSKTPKKVFGEKL